MLAYYSYAQEINTFSLSNNSNHNRSCLFDGLKKISFNTLLVLAHSFDYCFVPSPCDSESVSHTSCYDVVESLSHMSEP